MVKSICAALSSPPHTSLSQCFHKGHLSIHLYQKYRKQCDCLYDDNNIYHHCKKFQLKKRNCLNSISSAKHSFCECHSVKKHYVLYQDNDNTLKRLVPRQTMWYYVYVKDPPRNLQLANLFCLCIRCLMNVTLIL